MPETPEPVQVKVQCPACEKKFIPKLVVTHVQSPEEIDNDRVSRTVLERLTNVERRILHYVTQGAANKDIAGFLGTTEQVIKNYMRTIFDKTGMGNRVEVSVFVADHPLLRGELRKVAEGLPQ